MTRPKVTRLRAAAIVALAAIAAASALVLTAPSSVELDRRPDTLTFETDIDEPAVQPAEAVADRVFRIPGGGGVTTVFVTSRGVVLIDPKFAVSWTALEREVRRITDQPITHAVVTHFHRDHAEAVARMPPQVTVVGHTNAVERMVFYRFIPDDAVATGRARVYDDRMDLFEGDDTVSLRWPGPAHTNGDSVVSIPSAGLAMMGDVFPGKAFPTVHLEGGGDARRFPTVVRETLDALPKVTRFVTGHGPIASRQEFADYGEFMQFNIDYVHAEMGMFRDKTAIFNGMRLPARFADYDRARQFDTLDEIDRSLRPRWQRVF